MPAEIGERVGAIDQRLRRLAAQRERPVIGPQRRFRLSRVAQEIAAMKGGQRIAGRQFLRRRETRQRQIEPPFDLTRGAQHEMGARMAFVERDRFGHEPSRARSISPRQTPRAFGEQRREIERLDLKRGRGEVAAWAGGDGGAVHEPLALIAGARCP